jgi:uncharacterized protein YjbI with pentapeptide repeats
VKPEDVDAKGAVIEGALVLDGMTLRGLDLSGTHVKGDLSARGATFLGIAWLKDVKLDGALDLTGAQFRIDLRAEGLSAKALYLEDLQVRGVLALARVRTAQISLARALVMANLTLERAVVDIQTDLSDSEIMGGFWAEGARLGRLITTGCDLHGRRQAGGV